MKKFYLIVIFLLNSHFLFPNINSVRTPITVYDSLGIKDKIFDGNEEKITDNLDKIEIMKENREKIFYHNGNRANGVLDRKIQLEDGTSVIMSKINYENGKIKKFALYDIEGNLLIEGEGSFKIVDDPKVSLGWKQIFEGIIVNKTKNFNNINIEAKGTFNLTADFFMDYHKDKYEYLQPDEIFLPNEIIVYGIAPIDASILTADSYHKQIRIFSNSVVIEHKYWENGEELTSESFILNEGLVERRYNDGKLIFERFLKKPSIENPLKEIIYEKEFNDNGVLVTESIYDMKNTVYIEENYFNSEGMGEGEIVFSGEKIIYREDGSIERKEYYLLGELTSVKNYDKNNKNESKKKEKDLYNYDIKWERYGNARFNFWGNIPEHFEKMPPPENGDGIILTYKDMEVRLYGSNYILDTLDDFIGYEPLEAQLNWDIKIYNENKNEVTYKHKGKNFYVISGLTEDGNIFYKKDVYDKNDNKFVGFYAKYPYKDKEYMNNIIKKMTSDIRIYIDRDGKEYLEIK